MSLNSADPPLPGSSCESAIISITAGRAINPLDPSELLFPKVAVLGLAEDAIVLCRLLFLYCPCTRNKPAVSLSSVELVDTADNLSRDGKVTSRETLCAEPSSCNTNHVERCIRTMPL